MSVDRNEAAINTLWQTIDDRQDELIQLIAELVRIPSLLGDESTIQTYVARHLNESGLDTESWDLEDSVKSQPNAGDSGVPFPGRPNLTAVRKAVNSGAGRSLILNGHVDVVSPEPISAWTHDPWGAEIDGDRMYGRGAYDMKSGVGLNLFITRLLNDLGIELAGDLKIHSVIEEECTGNGALAASLRDRADAALVTEPQFGSYTQAHLGVIWFKVRIEGVSAHAGWAWQGVNAIVKSVPVIEALRDLNESMNLQVHPVWEGVQHPINLNIGVIRGGDWPSTVPGACELHCRTSFFPDDGVPGMRVKIENAVKEAAATDEWLSAHPPVITYDGFHTNGSVVSPDEPFIQALNAAHVRVTGRNLNPHVATAVNDMRYYLFQGIPSTCYGAKGANGHAADEWLDLMSLPTAAKTIAAFVVDWCGVV
jgi:acetylornithine deacetylase